MSRAAAFRRAAIALAVVAIADVGLALGHEWCVRRFSDANGLAAGASYRCAVVFFGGLDEHGELDAETRTRIGIAAGLYASARVREIIAVGGARPRWPRTGASIMADSLRNRGIPVNRLFHDTSSYDSISNWDQAVRIARARNADSLVLVSSWTHLFRLSQIVGTTELAVAYVGGDRLDAVGLTERWRRAHRESLALAGLWLLPRSWYVSLVRHSRLS